MAGTPDEVVGRNVRLLRETSGLSQADVAAAMAEDGLSWYPQTVTRVEHGTRSLKLVEAMSLARVLGVGATYLYEAPSTAGNDQQVRRAMSTLGQALSGLERAEQALLAAYEDLRDLLDELDLSEDVLKAAEATLSSVDDELIERKREEDEQEAAIEAAGERWMQLQTDIERGK